MEKILFKIENEKPSEAALQNYFYNFEATCQRAQEITGNINRINAIGQIQNLGSFISSIAKNVLQRPVGYTQAKERYPIIGSFGAGPCLTMAVYNPKHKTAALCHIDSMTNLNSLHSIFSNLNPTKDKDTPVEIHLAGGDESSKEMVAKVINIIENFEYAKIISASIVRPNPAQLAIDSRTGEVFTDFSAHQLNLGENISMRLKTVSFIFTQQSLAIEPGLKFNG